MRLELVLPTVTMFGPHGYTIHFASCRLRRCCYRCMPDVVGPHVWLRVAHWFFSGSRDLELVREQVQRDHAGKSALDSTEQPARTGRRLG